LGNELVPSHLDSDNPLWKEHEATDAAHLLANFFGGKVVDDDNGTDLPTDPAIEVSEPEIEPEEPTLEPWTNSSSDTDLETDLEDDDDIPF